MDHIQQAINQASSYGLSVTELDTSGKLVRVPVDGDKGQKRSGWYVAHKFILKNGKIIVVGRYGNWKFSDEKKSFEADCKLSEEDRNDLKAKQSVDRKRVDTERIRANNEAVKRSAELSKKLATTGNTKYLTDKKVRGYGVYYGKGDTLFVPVIQHGHGLVGFQVIGPDGSKKFLTGTEKRGGYHLIGADVECKTLLIAEGYATAASLHEATGFPCFIAFDTGNLLPVAKLIRKLHPYKKIVICADDDHVND